MNANSQLAKLMYLLTLVSRDVGVEDPTGLYLVSEFQHHVSSALVRGLSGDCDDLGYLLDIAKELSERQQNQAKLVNGFTWAIKESGLFSEA